MKNQDQSSVWSSLWTNQTAPSSLSVRFMPRRSPPGPRRRPSSLPCSGKPPASPPARFHWQSLRSPPRSEPARDPMPCAKRLTPAAPTAPGRSFSYSRVCEKLEICHVYHISGDNLFIYSTQYFPLQRVPKMSFIQETLSIFQQCHKSDK